MVDHPDARDYKSGYTMTDEQITRAVAVFKEAGFNVSEEAIRHNLEGWRDDLKSQFVDKEEGYLLFTPCGCNPLQFDAYPLSEFSSEQETYYA